MTNAFGVSLFYESVYGDDHLDDEGNWFNNPIIHVLFFIVCEEIEYDRKMRPDAFLKFVTFLIYLRWTLNFEFERDDLYY